jgi:hypothetical protein
MNAHTKQKIRAFLESGGVISQLNGMEVAQTTCAKDYCGFLRRDDGLPVKGEWRKTQTGKRYKSYFLQKEVLIGG